MKPLTLSVRSPSDTPHALTAAQTLECLHSWAQVGGLRRLDVALAAQMLRLDANASPALLVATAWLAHMEGRGHTCLPLADVLRPPVLSLAWPARVLHGEAGLLALWSQLPQTLTGWQHALHSPVLRAWDAPDAGQPLVLGGTAAQPLLYLRRYAACEQRVGQGLRARAQARWPLDEAWVRPCLDALFGAPQAQVDWQRTACALALRAPLAVITGGPGTGKTYTAARLLALLLALHRAPTPLRVALAAPTGKAAARLKQAIDQALQHLPAHSPLEPVREAVARMAHIGAARTLHALLGARPDTRRMRHHAGHLLDVDVLLVDEASMVHLEMMDALLAALPAHARLVLLGDKDQLSSVEAGAVLGDLCQHAALGAYADDTARYLQVVTGQRLSAAFLAPSPAPVMAQVTAMLRHSHRFDGPIGALAQAVNAGDAARARALLQAEGGEVGGVRALSALRPQTPLAVCDVALQAAGGWRDYVARVRAAPSDPAAHADWVRGVLQAFDALRVLCAVREGPWGVAGLNTALQKALAEHARLPVGSSEWYVGRPVMVLRNDAQTGVFNGDVGVALPAAQGGKASSDLRVWFANGAALRSVAVMRLPEVQTAFAMTVHKSQGSEFGHTVLVLPPGAGELLTRELVYTGITRAQRRLTLVETADGLLEMAIARPAARTSGLARWWA